ncbi:hypothetical protein [Caulobacter sp. LARHSG274]
MTPLEAMICILGPVGIAVGIYGIFLRRELDALIARREGKHHAE